MDKPAQLRIFECTDGRRRYAGTTFLDEWLQYVIGRLPAHEIEQIHNDLTVTGKATALDAFGRRFEYEIVGGRVAG